MVCLDRSRDDCKVSFEPVLLRRKPRDTFRNLRNLFVDPLNARYEPSNCRLKFIVSHVGLLLLPTASYDAGKPCQLCYNTAMSNVVIYTDGGARGNPGPAAAGVVIIDGAKKREVKAYLGPRQTNNWAEYEAVVLALGTALEMLLSGRDLEFRLDSQLVVEQLKGNWKIKEPELKKQAHKVRDLLNDFGTVTFTYIPREENKEADRLVNEALDEMPGSRD